MQGVAHLKLDLGLLLGDLQDLGGVVRAPKALLLHEHLCGVYMHDGDGGRYTAGHRPPLRRPFPIKH